MKNTCILILVLLYAAIAPAQGTKKYRNGIFLHHSTGGLIWSQGGATTSVPAEIVKYNTAKGLRTTDTVSLTERYWPYYPSGGENEWVLWNAIFKGTPYNAADSLGAILPGNRIVIVKSCYPSSAMTGLGTPADTVGGYPGTKSVYAYKWIWRNIVRKMGSIDSVFWCIWTNTPLEPASTNDAEAGFANAFCTWAKDTLAMGLDSRFGPFPKNVYVFDFFHKLADASGKMKVEYRFAAGNSHPNAAATNHVAPQLVNELFDAALTYEGGGANSVNDERPMGFMLYPSYPNPFNPRTELRFTVDRLDRTTLTVYDVTGRIVRTLFAGVAAPGETYTTTLEGGGLASGIYYCVLRNSARNAIQKVALLK